MAKTNRRGVSSGTEHSPPKRKTRARFLHAPPEPHVWFDGTRLTPNAQILVEIFAERHIPVIYNMGDDDYGDCDLVSVTHTPTLEDCIELTLANWHKANLVDSIFSPYPWQLNVPLIYQKRRSPPFDCKFPSRKRRTGVIDFDDKEYNIDEE